MKINYKSKTIELTTSENKKSSKVGSDEYNVLLEVRKQNPGFEVVVIKRTVHRTARPMDRLKGLTFDYMTNYAQNHGSDKQKQELNEKLKRNKDGLTVKSESYAKVRKWFLEQFPEIKSYCGNSETKEDEKQSA